MNKKFAAAITAGVIAATSLISTGPAFADAGTLEIRNSSSSTKVLMVCRNWTGTRCAEPYKALFPGKSTKSFGWSDVDAVRLDSNRKYYTSAFNWGVYNDCGGSTVQEKRAGSPLGKIETWTVYGC